VALLPGEVRLELGGVDVYMTHIGGKPQAWHPRLPQPRPGVAICGHSHIALLERLDSTLFLNPGAAGTRRRFNNPLSAALLRVADGRADVEILWIED
jgi:predicted phosphodiesterase